MSTAGMSTAGMSTAGMSTEGSLTSDGPPPYRLVRPHEGQAPKGTPHLFKAAASNTAGRFDFVTASFAPRTGPPLHLHLEQDDTFYVLDGVLTAHVPHFSEAFYVPHPSARSARRISAASSSAVSFLILRPRST
jgi:hypothetical protein